MLLIEYFKLIPEFTKISIDSKICFIKNHFSTMFGLSEAMNPLDKCATLYITLTNIHGIEFVMDAYR